MASAVNETATIAFGYDQDGTPKERDECFTGLGSNRFGASIATANDGRAVQAQFMSPYSPTVGYSLYYDSFGRPVEVVGANSGATHVWGTTTTAVDGVGAYDALGRIADSRGYVQSNGGTVTTKRTYGAYSGQLVGQVTKLGMTGLLGGQHGVPGREADPDDRHGHRDCLRLGLRHGRPSRDGHGDGEHVVGPHPELLPLVRLRRSGTSPRRTSRGTAAARPRRGTPTPGRTRRRRRRRLPAGLRAHPRWDGEHRRAECTALAHPCRDADLHGGGVPQEHRAGSEHRTRSCTTTRSGTSPTGGAATTSGSMWASTRPSRRRRPVRPTPARRRRGP